MFVYIKFKSKLQSVPKVLDSYFKSYDKNFILKNYDANLAYVLEYRNKKSSENIALCDLELNYEFSDSDVLLSAIDLNFAYVYPPYIDQALMVKKVFQSIYQLFGEYSVFDSFSGKWFKYEKEEDLDSFVSLMSTVLTSSNSALIEMYKEDFIKKTNIKEFHKFTKKYTDEYALYLTRSFYNSTIISNNMTYEISEEIFEIYLKLLASVKDVDLKGLYLYKILSPIKAIDTRFLWLKPRYALGKLIDIYKGLDPSQELTQLLFLDFTIGILNNHEYRDYKQVVDELVEFLKGLPNYQFSNIIEAFHCYINTGDKFNAVKTYYNILNENKELREKYFVYKQKDPLTKTNVIRSFETGIIEAWFKSLNFFKKISMIVNRLKYAAGVPTGQLMGFFIGTVASVLSLVLIFTTFYINTHIEGYVVKEGLINGDLVAGMIVISFVSQILLTYYVTGALWAIKNRFLSFIEDKKAKIAFLIVYIPILLIMMFSSYRLLTIAMYSDANLTAVSNDVFIYRDIKYKFDDVASVRYGNVLKAQRPLTDYIKINVTFKNGQSLEIRDHGLYKPKARASLCNLLKKFEDEIENRKINSEVKDAYIYKSNYCRK